MANITLVQMAWAIGMIKNLEEKREALTAYEWLFIKGLAEWHAPYFSDRQFAWLRKIHDRVIGNVSVDISEWFYN